MRRRVHGAHCESGPMSARIGVTGHRVLPADFAFRNQTKLAVDNALDLARKSGQVIVVSALAEGADRLVASDVLDRPGGLLEVVLPTTPGEYERDFADADSRDEFRRLLGLAQSVTVVQPGESRTANFERAGHAMLDE